MTDVEFNNLLGRLHSMTGSPIAADNVANLLRDVLKGGGGVRIELDHQRLSLILREGRFMLKREERRSLRPPSKPPFR